jgi:hypothetical protein
LVSLEALGSKFGGKTIEGFFRIGGFATIVLKLHYLLSFGSLPIVVSLCLGKSQIIFLVYQYFLGNINEWINQSNVFFLKSSSQILNCYFKGCLSLSQCRALADIDLGICKAIFFHAFLW